MGILSWSEHSNVCVHGSRGRAAVAGIVQG